MPTTLTDPPVPEADIRAAVNRIGSPGDEGWLYGRTERPGSGGWLYDFAGRPPQGGLWPTAHEARLAGERIMGRNFGWCAYYVRQVNHPIVTSAMGFVVLPQPDRDEQPEPEPRMCRNPECDVNLDEEDYPSDLEWCDDCRECSRCRHVVSEDEITTTLRGSEICQSCRDSHYYQCEWCDGWNRNGYDCYEACESLHDADDCEDDDCTECGRASGHTVMSYGYKPRPIFHGSGTKLFLGPELEIEAGRSYADAARVAQGHLGALGYLKSDGSLTRGFEIVTHPMTYDYAIGSFPWEMLDELKALGCTTPSDHTGLHVHLSRDGFRDPAHVYRWMKFVYRNHRQVVRVARRESREWASFDPTYREQILKHAKGDRYGARYQAINPCNDATFEMRIFAASLNPAEVQASFAFAVASAEYARNLTAAEILHNDGWSWAAFESWVAERDEYAPLTNQLKGLALCAS